MSKRTILVDVDGVLARYDGWKGVEHFGDPIEGAREFLLKLAEQWEVAIWTTRCNAEVNADSELDESDLVALVAEWLHIHDLPYDRIIPGKPISVAIIDDNAIRCLPQVDPFAYANAYDIAAENIK